MWVYPAYRLSDIMTMNEPLFQPCRRSRFIQPNPFPPTHRHILPSCFSFPKFPPKSTLIKPSNHPSKAHTQAHLQTHLQTHPTPPKSPYTTSPSPPPNQAHSPRSPPAPHQPSTCVPSLLSFPCPRPLPQYYWLRHLQAEQVRL